MGYYRLVICFPGTKTGDLSYYIDVTQLHIPRPQMEVQSYMKDGQVDNWDMFEKMLDYCYSKVPNSPCCYKYMANLVLSGSTSPVMHLIEPITLRHKDG